MPEFHKNNDFLVSLVRKLHATEVAAIPQVSRATELVFKVGLVAAPILKFQIPKSGFECQNFAKVTKICSLFEAIPRKVGMKWSS